MEDQITTFALTTFRNARRRFGIKRDDRRRHFYAVGKTGMGKTELLKSLAIQDIQRGNGMGFLDPHGEAVDDLLDFVPKERIQDVVYFNPADTEYPVAFNVMEEVDPDNRHLVASGIMSVFKKIWPDVWSARMEYILNYTILALLESPGATLLGINRMLSDVLYRKSILDDVKDPIVKSFWTQEFSRYAQRYETEATAAIQNKVGQFISNPLVRNIIGQKRSSVPMREVMDGEKILLANLSKGKIGEDNSRLLGGLLATKLQLAAMSRVTIPERDRKDFYLYIDEFQTFATESFINILSEARKYRLALTLSHQYIAQLEETGVKDAVFGNVGTMVAFRVGAEDAEALEKEFQPEIMAQDLINLGKYQVYVKLMIDGVAGAPFSAQTLPPSPVPEISFRDEIIKHSRREYAVHIREVEGVIREWAGIKEASGEEGVLLEQIEPREVQPLYDATCSNCGKPAKVVFEPDGKRPVYCKACRKKMKRPPEAQAHEEEKRPQSREAISPRVPKSISLKEAIASAPGRAPEGLRNNEKKNGKGVNEQGLREALDSALKSRPADRNEERKEGANVPNSANRGVLNPGDTVHFSNS